MHRVTASYLKLNRLAAPYAALGCDISNGLPTKRYGIACSLVVIYMAPAIRQGNTRLLAWIGIKTTEPRISPPQSGISGVGPSTLPKGDG